MALFGESLMLRKLFQWFVVGVLGATVSTSAENVTVKIDCGQISHRISPRFYGVNTLFWIEDDATLADPSFGEFVRHLDLKLFRYPGGTVAENFDWRRSDLIDPAFFPHEGGPGASGFDEITAFARRHEAELSLVVATEEFAATGRMDAGAKEAADWVKHARAVQAPVAIWEIGNETYWHPVMNAREYGRLVARYAKAMRAVDPDIRLGANGHWSSAFVATKERLSAEERAKALKARGEIADRADYQAYKKTVAKDVSLPVFKGGRKWWRQVFAECAEHIDYLGVHWYFGQHNIAHIDTELNRLRRLYREYAPEREIGIYLSEYNWQGGFSGGDAILISGMAEAIGRFHRAKVEAGAFWPLQSRGQWARLSLWNKDQVPVARRPNQRIFALLSKHLRGDFLELDLPESVFVAAAVPDAGWLTVLLGGYATEQPQDITLDLGAPIDGYDLHAFRAVLDQPQGAVGEQRRAEKAKAKQSQIQITVRPRDTVVLSIKLAGQQ